MRLARSLQEGMVTVRFCPLIFQVLVLVQNALILTIMRITVIKTRTHTISRILGSVQHKKNACHVAMGLAAAELHANDLEKACEDI